MSTLTKSVYCNFIGHSTIVSKLLTLYMAGKIIGEPRLLNTCYDKKESNNQASYWQKRCESSLRSFR